MMYTKAKIVAAILEDFFRISPRQILAEGEDIIAIKSCFLKASCILALDRLNVSYIIIHNGNEDHKIKIISNRYILKEMSSFLRFYRNAILKRPTFRFNMIGDSLIEIGNKKNIHISKKRWGHSWSIPLFLFFENELQNQDYEKKLQNQNYDHVA